MGIFGRKDSITELQEPSSTENNKIEVLRDEIKGKYLEASKINGSKGSGEGIFSMNTKYVFYITEDKYVFTPLYSSYIYLDSKKMEEMLDLKIIELDKSE